jgi:hypothetical protein
MIEFWRLWADLWFTQELGVRTDYGEAISS